MHVFSEYPEASKFNDGHENVVEVSNEELGLYGFISIHRGNSLVPAFGATRLWTYPSRLAALQESLQLAKAMSYKAALADIPYRGGKAVLIATNDLVLRKPELIEKYCEYVNQLQGAFITGADVGISPDDVKLMKTQSDYIVGVIHDPVFFTVFGLYQALQAALAAVYGSPSAIGKSFAIQGLGKIGEGFLRQVYNEESTFYVADIDQSRIEELRIEFPKLIPVPTDKIHTLPVDVFSPCATSHCLSSKTVPELNCRIVFGGANNQLESSDLATAMYERNILYAPDYVINAGGLISVVSEYDDPTISVEALTQKVARIGDTLETILRTSEETNLSPLIVANEIGYNRINLHG